MYASFNMFVTGLGEAVKVARWRVVITSMYLLPRWLATAKSWQIWVGKIGVFIVREA